MRAVDGVSFSLAAGGTLGIVGESGCGKTVLSLSIMGLVPSPPGRVESGEILFEGQDLRRLRERELRALRGRRIAMIFQEPMTALNPVYTVGARARSSSCVRSASPRRTSASTRIRTSSRAACASG